MIQRLASKLALATLLAIPALANSAQPIIDVYKTAACGCCKEWAKHLTLNGFQVRTHDVEDPAAVRKSGGISDEYGSCHTAKVGKYVVEGHVPAADIKRLLRDKPKAAGLAVPGMPMGSPGMEGGHRDAYEVLLIQKGRASVSSRYR